MIQASHLLYPAGAPSLSHATSRRQKHPRKTLKLPKQKPFLSSPLFSSLPRHCTALKSVSMLLRGSSMTTKPRKNHQPPPPLLFCPALPQHDKIIAPRHSHPRPLLRLTLVGLDLYKRYMWGTGVCVCVCVDVVHHPVKLKRPRPKS